MQTRLGDLYQRLGLTSEAMRQFQEAAEVCQTRGMKSEAFELLKRIASLDPSNISNRLSLADLLAREGMESDARTEFESLLREVEGEESDERVRVGKRARSAFPDHLPFCLSLASVLCGAGAAEEAIELLEQERVERADAVDLREALVWALQAQGKTESVRGVWREIAELYKRRGDVDHAREILQRYVPVEGLGDDPESNPSIVLQDELIDSLGEGLEAATPVPAGGSPRMDVSPAASVQASPETATSEPSDLDPDEVLAEVRVALEFGSLDDAREGVQRVLASVPDCDAASELEAQIAERCGQLPAALEIQERRRGLALSLGDAEKVVQIDAEVARLRPLAAESQAEPVSLGTLPDIEIVLDDEEDQDSQWASVSPPAELELSAEPDSDLEAEEAEEAERWELDLESVDELPDTESLDGGASITGTEIASVANSLASGAYDADVTESGEGDRLEVVEAETSASSWAEDSSRIVESLDAAEQQLARGEIEAAEASYRAVLLEIPNHPQALARIGEIAARRGESPELVPDPEVEGFVEADPTLEAGDFDLAAELSQALAPTAGKPDAGTSGRGFESVLEAFKDGIREQLGPEECDARYDLAIAYREMGLLDDAVEALLIAIEGRERRIESLSLLATCELDLGRPESAIGHLDSGLAELAPEDPVALALRYERAGALQAAGRGEDALAGYREVAVQDATYRDTTAKIAELEKLQD